MSQKVDIHQHSWKLETFVFYVQASFRSNFEANFQFQHFMLHNLKIIFFDFFVKTRNWSVARIQTKKITCFRAFFLVGLRLCVSKYYFSFLIMQIFSVYFQKTIAHFFDKILGKLWNLFCSNVNSTTLLMFWKHLPNSQYCKIEMKP